MLPVLQVVTLLFVAVAMTCALAHALELPGKLRLSRDAYLTVQRVYYPGFTVVGGFGELFALLGAVVLVAVTPQSGPAFGLTVAACIALALGHAVFWVITQPANRYWMRYQQMSPAGAAFFRTDADTTMVPDWTILRSRWEYSHVVRAVLFSSALVLVASATAAT
jgi:hypothetical protein